MMASTKDSVSRAAVPLAFALLLGQAATATAATWADRSGDLQNSGNVGNDPGLTFDNVKDLKVVDFVPTEGAVNATPVVAEGLMVTGDWIGKILVVDVAANPAKVLLKIDTQSSSSLIGVGTLQRTGVAEADAAGDKTGLGHLSQEFGNYKGMQSTPAIASVTLPSGLEELRAYVAVNTNQFTLWCINLTKVAADRGPLNADPGGNYLCSGNDSEGNPAFPRTLSTGGFGLGNGVINGALMFSADQPIVVNGSPTVRDVLYTPTTGLDCADGQMWALDALTGEKLWDFDPVPGDAGGTIWTTPAMNADKSLVYVSTGDCVTKPQVGAKAESVVALDATDGHVVWFHQKRLIDTADLDIGTGIAVADVGGFQGCHVVLSSDKDGCIYAYDQQPDIPADVTDPGYDPLRAGQQRVLWRKCFVGGSLNGGFNASNGAVWGRLFVQQASGYPDCHIGADDSNAFAVDVCNGQVQWASSDISNGRTDAAIASDMLFQLGVVRKFAGGPDTPYQWVQEVTVAAMDSGIGRVPTVLATVELPAQGSLGGGGLAIADGTLFVPTVKGVAIARVVPNSNASPPVRRGLNVFAGPYPEPVSPGPTALVLVNPDDPYPLMLRKPGVPDTFRSLSEGGLQGAFPDTEGVVPE